MDAIPGGIARHATWLAGLGEAMRRHAGIIRALQWAVVIFYLFLVAVPAFMPLPERQASILNNLTLLAQFLFWGIWWPFVMLSMMLLGRLWCGIFCPEGALSEWVSHHGLGRPVPRWLKWHGWPFLAFIMTTIYGQLVSVYEYPKATLLILGGSTVAAMAVGFVYGRGKRVWCRHLCPANGVFALLAKVAPLHFRVDRAAWERPEGAIVPVNCAPLVDIRRMNSTSSCHACGRCSGHRGAVELAVRSPNREILGLKAGEVGRTEALLLIFGVIGTAMGAFQWTLSPWFVAMKQGAAKWLVEHDAFLLLQDNAPWWLLTHYPEANDVFTWLDGLCILAYIGGIALSLGGLILGGVTAAARLAGNGKSWPVLTMALVPLGGVNVFLGLSMLTVTLLKAEGIALPWVAHARVALLALGMSWSLWLGWRLIATRVSFRAVLGFAAYALPVMMVGGTWLTMFFVW